jgi:asparagine synthase (glutamine-hydrolysing)
MCGIAGTFQYSGSDEKLPFVQAATRSQRRRGPDHQDVIRAASGPSAVVLGHNRLSVIDLSNEANQPMWDVAGTICIVYNGEIYNYLEIRQELRALGHHFRTESDTEVIIEGFKRWGPRAFNRFNGMFAFALYDRIGGQLWMVRDRFGVKPLYYALDRDSLLFASTPGPIARELGSQPNLEYVSRGLHYWVYEDDSSDSQYVGVHAVPAGCYVVAVARPSGPPTITVTRWYDFEAAVGSLRDELALTSESVLVSRFAELLQQSISIRLRADVPVGVSLSGGLDSSAIACTIASSGAAARAFSYGDPGNGASEGPLVAALAHDLRFPVTYTQLDDAERVSSYWETLEAQDAPFPDTSIVAQYAVFRAARLSNTKVLLGGQGADEALMGYRKFQLVLLREAIRNGDHRHALELAAGMSLMLRSELARFSTYWRQRNRYARRHGMVIRLRLPTPVGLNLLGGRRRSGWLRQVDDMRILSLPTLLRYEDRNSTWNSLETRLPFLDFRLAEFAVALPDAMKVRRGYGKWVLRLATKARVPENIRLARYKRGFDAPRRVWISAGLGASMRERLHELRPIVSQWLPSGESLNSVVSDDRLIHDPTAFAEATTLLWLGNRG